MKDFQEVYGTPGAFSWNELMTGDAKAATAFYGSLFGWTFDTMDMGQGPYHVIKVGGTAIGGMMSKPDPNMPSCWGSYVTVANCDETAAKAKSLGATLCAEPFDIPGVGRMTVIQDPQGAVIQAIAYFPK